MGDFTCKYCKKSFIKESSYLSHVCKYKRRYESKNDPEFRVALSAYQLFYTMEMGGKKKSMDDFVHSDFYNDFIKFGRFCVEYDIPYINKYATYCIKNKLKIKKWRDPLSYDEFLFDHQVNKESPEEAVARSIEEIQKWSRKSGKNECEFFREAELNQAAWMIRTGRISPWVLYIAPSGKQLLDELDEQHMKELANILNPTIWHKKFLTNGDSIEYLYDLLEKGGF